MTEAVIVACGRSAIGRARKVSLVDVRPDDLAAFVLGKVVDKVPQLDRSEIEDVICGCGLPGGEQGHNIGRVISILARLDVPGCTVNRYCSSSLMTTRIASHAIKSGEGDVFVSAGVECVSRYGSGYPEPPDSFNPKLVPGNTAEYPDIYIAMGQTAEPVAEREKISREELDRYAVKRQEAAVKARDDGFSEREVMRLAPIDASRPALKRAGMTIDDVDILEINEAFAAQVIPSARALGVDPCSDKLNPHGGAIALGHPFGMTGARILCTLLNG